MEWMEQAVFSDCLKEQLRRHPAMAPQDLCKLCYQAAYGAEHLLEDLQGAWDFFTREFEQVPASGEPLVETISRRICRVNLGAWKQAGLPGRWLFALFADTRFDAQGYENLTELLQVAGKVLTQGAYEISLPEWNAYVAEYQALGMPSLRHTEQYRTREQPAYRIVSTNALRLLPVLQRLAQVQGQQRPYVIALDGRAGAGKSTVAEQLRRVLDAGVVYMDDFFLPLDLRSRERLEQAGGNVHYERFAQQVLPKLHGAEPFAYDIFDCSRKDYYGQRQVEGTDWRIVEGSYSHHPQFGDYADLRVFVDVEPEEQLRRIQIRNGLEWAEQFRTRWIPMEEAYFSAYEIPQQADLKI